MDRVESPRTDDAGIEQRIRAAGKTAARVTPADIEANIVASHYFTAFEGVTGRFVREGANKVAMTVDAPLHTLTFCVLVLRNGFTVTGESAPASPENFDADIGRSIAYENAKQRVWPLMGYSLKQDLWRASLPQMTPAEAPVPTDFRDRVRAEHRRLNEDLSKLETFIDSERFGALPVDERQRMKEQAVYMRGYSTILAKRIAAFGD